MVQVRFLAQKAREASVRLGMLSTEAKNGILRKIAERLETDQARILKANVKDMNAGVRNGLDQGLLDRLLLNKERLRAVIADVKKVASLKDYIGEILESRELPNGLLLKRVRVPIGVIGMIYEARPNVTVDSAVLCLKSGNAVILKGGSDALHTNRAIVSSLQEALKEVAGLAPETRLQDCVQLIDSSDRKAAQELMSTQGLVDVIIPRGGKGLIQFVRENSRVPVIETGASVVHTYIHEDADMEKAVSIVMNAKLRRISICNTLDSLLLHKKIAAKFLKAFVEALPENPYKARHLEIRAAGGAWDALKKMPKLKNFALIVKKAGEEDFSTEFLDYVLAVKSVSSLDEALEHIARRSLKHSEAIITESEVVAQKFLKTVDAACVYWNASPQFSDGGQFGLGAEIGISTQKLHVRGPFALEGLTSYKWIIEGTGQIRPA